MSTARFDYTEHRWGCTLRQPQVMVYFGLLMATGCITFGRYTTHVEHGAPLDPKRVEQIVIGDTTRADVFRWFGPPHSMFKDEAELFNYEHVGFYSYLRNRRLESIDEGSYVLLYLFRETDAYTKIKIRAAPFSMQSEIDNEVTFAGDELMILLDRDTHVVTDVAWRSKPTEQ